MSTSLSKFRQRRLKKLENDVKPTEEKSINNAFCQRNNLYSRQEFELLDTIYADDPGSGSNISKDTAILDEFWHRNNRSKEQNVKITDMKNPLITKLTWFLSGVILTSVVWFMYFQISIHQIKTKHATQIVFHKSAEILTDKTADKQIIKVLGKEKTNGKHFAFPDFFSKRTEAKIITEPSESKLPQEPKVAEEPLKALQPAQPVRFHTVQNGDSLWIIANKYYSDPSEANISKIAKANNLRLNSILTLGNKLVVP